MSLPNPNMDFSAFDTLPATELDDIVENIEALADGSGMDSTAVLIQSNPYKFSAYKSGAQNLVSGTVTKVLFATENYDTNNNFASSTYTVPVNGFYRISATLKVSTQAANSYFAMIYVNGAEVRRGPEIIPGYANNFGVTVQDTLQLTAGQTVEIYAYSGTGTGAIATGANIGYFSGEIVSRT